MLDHLDLGDRRPVQRERALDAHALADLADGERLAQAAAAHVDDLSAKLLLALLVALDHPHRDLDGIPGPELRAVGLDVGGFHLFQQAHGRAPFGLHGGDAGGLRSGAGVYARWRAEQNRGRRGPQGAGGESRYRAFTAPSVTGRSGGGRETLGAAGAPEATTYSSQCSIHQRVESGP